MPFTTEKFYFLISIKLLAIRTRLSKLNKFIYRILNSIRNSNFFI